MNTFPSPEVPRIPGTFRTGRRYFEYQKNTQTSSITFSQDYYQNTYAQPLTLQRRYYQTLSEQPPTRPRPEYEFLQQSNENPPVDAPVKAPQRDASQFQGAPSLDDRLALALEEKKRAEDMKQRNYEALKLQIMEGERRRKVMQLERERKTALRMQELRELEDEQKQERTRQLSRSLQYRSTLDLQSQLKMQLNGSPNRRSDQSPSESPFSPLIRSTLQLPRNKDHLAVDLAPLPEFQQTRYTARHPKRVPTNPLGFPLSPQKPQPLPEDLRADAAKFFGVEEGEQRDLKKPAPMPRSMSDYGNMVLRPMDKSPFAEPVYSRRPGLNYSDTRHLIN